MEATNQFLFVYGTLLQPGNQFADYLTQHCRFVNDGKVKGRLYDIGEYPGAVIDDNEERSIYGCIFIMDEPELILKVIDDYEGIGELYEYPQEYVRQQVDVFTDDGDIKCWIYVYNLSVNDFLHIIGGDYMQYLNNAVK